MMPHSAIIGSFFSCVKNIGDQCLRIGLSFIELKLWIWRNLGFFCNILPFSYQTRFSDQGFRWTYHWKNPGELVCIEACHYEGVEWRQRFLNRSFWKGEGRMDREWFIRLDRSQQVNQLLNILTSYVELSLIAKKVQWSDSLMDRTLMYFCRFYPGVAEALKFSCSEIFIVTTKQVMFHLLLFSSVILIFPTYILFWSFFIILNLHGFIYGQL